MMGVLVVLGQGAAVCWDRFQDYFPFIFISFPFLSLAFFPSNKLSSYVKCHATH